MVCSLPKTGCTHGHTQITFHNHIWVSSRFGFFDKRGHCFLMPRSGSLRPVHPEIIHHKTSESRKSAIELATKCDRGCGRGDVFTYAILKNGTRICSRKRGSVTLQLKIFSLFRFTAFVTISACLSPKKKDFCLYWWLASTFASFSKCRGEFQSDSTTSGSRG